MAPALVRPVAHVLGECNSPEHGRESHCLGGVREEGVEPPVWSVLAEAARTALTRLVTVQARVVEVVPVRGFAGESQSRTVTVAWASPDLWRILLRPRDPMAMVAPHGAGGVVTGCGRHG